VPSADTFPMSGLPPPGTGHVATTFLAIASITLIEPGPCAPACSVFQPRLVA